MCINLGEWGTYFRSLFMRPNVIRKAIGVALSAFTVVTASAHTITTIAGGGVADGMDARQSYMQYPSGIAVDSAGNVYVSSENHIRRVGTDGVISTFAGNGQPAPSGPVPGGILAIDSALGGPRGLAIALDGSVLFVEGGHRIRRVSTGGVITTIAGQGVAGFSGDGSAASSAQINDPTALIVTSDGSIIFSDTGNHRIRKIAPDGTISTIAGTGAPGLTGDGAAATSAQLRSPQGLTMSPDGTIYFADRDNNRIRKISPAGVISSIADGGFATDVSTGNQVPIYRLFRPKDVKIDGGGALVIAESQGNRVIKIDANGQRSVLVGSDASVTFGNEGDGGPSVLARVSNPSALAIHGGAIFIADTDNNRVRKIDSMGQIDAFAGAGANFTIEGKQATNVPLDLTALAYGQNGKIYFSTYQTRSVYLIQADGSILRVAGNGNFGSAGEGVPATSVGLGNPIGIAADRDGRIYIVDSYSKIWIVGTDGMIAKFAGNGLNINTGDGGPAVDAGLVYPVEIQLDRAGRAFIRCNESIRMVSNGQISTIRPDHTAGLAVDWRGNVFFSNLVPSQLWRLRPGNLAINLTDNVFGSGDSGNGGLARFAGTAARRVAVDVVGGLYFVNQSNATTIRRITLAGEISRVAGGGSDSLASGVDALSASLSSSGIALSPSGEIYVQGSDRIRKISIHDQPSAATNISVLPASSRAVISFAPPTNSGGRPIIGYFADCGSENAQAFSRSSPVIVDGLTNGTTNQCQLFAINDKTVGIPSAPIPVTPSASSPFSYLGAVSRRGASPSGEFDLPIEGSGTVDPRSYAGNREIVMRFSNQPTTVGSVTSSAGLAGYSISGNDLRVFLDGSVDKKQVTISATGVNAQLDVSMTIRFATGDYTRTGSINASDIAALKANIGKYAFFANTELDIDGSGMIDVNDVRIAKSRSGMVVN